MAAETLRLECLECNKVFTKTFKRVTHVVRCPRCRSEDVDLAVTR